MFDIFLQAETWIALLTLTFLEIVLGIDNIIFISIVSNKLPAQQQTRGRTLGISLALVVRILMLSFITWIIGLSEPLFTVLGVAMGIRELILLAGGLFLLAKSTTEIHHKIEGMGQPQLARKAHSLPGVVFQIVMIDIVFSFDSILTAIGMTRHLPIMIIAVVIAMVAMILFSGAIAAFIRKHPTIEILALSFLILIGFMLVLESLHMEVPKGYIYFAVFFSLMVEMLNMRFRKRSEETIQKGEGPLQ